jgi:Amt family ammonium transporter
MRSLTKTSGKLQGEESMSLINRLTGGLGAGALSLLAFAGSALAQAPDPSTFTIPEATVEPGHTSFMIIATVLVLLMTVPGLALFYGGLVRTKNMLSVLMQVFTITALMMILWVVVGYSLAFTANPDSSLNPFIGGFAKMFLAGVTPSTLGATFSNGSYIPEYVFVCFQMTFACITPALIVGAFAERIKFSGMLLFMVGWSLLAYYPMAHMVWYWGGPDIFGTAALDLMKAGGEAASEEAKAAYAAVIGDAGYLFSKGALDFAGGTVVHINAGIAGLVLCVLLGKRVGYGRDAMPPHSLTMTMIGASLLWVGWFGFNAGSNLEANGTAALAMINTFVGTAAAALAWMFAEWLFKGHPSLLGAVSGAVAGLVAVTPACGWVGPMGAIMLCAIAGIVCFFFCTTVKNALKYDDSLDVFGVHCVGGIIGAIGTGVFCDPALGGTGLVDYLSAPGTLVTPATYDMAAQVWIQTQGVLVTVLVSGIVSTVLFFLINFTIGMRVKEDQEREGLDISSHGERAYNM